MKQKSNVKQYFHGGAYCRSDFINLSYRDENLYLVNYDSKIKHILLALSTKKKKNKDVANLKNSFRQFLNNNRLNLTN